MQLYEINTLAKSARSRCTAARETRVRACWRIARAGEHASIRDGRGTAHMSDHLRRAVPKRQPRQAACAAWPSDLRIARPLTWPDEAAAKGSREGVPEDCSRGRARRDSRRGGTVRVSDRTAPCQSLSLSGPRGRLGRAVCASPTPAPQRSRPQHEALIYKIVYYLWREPLWRGAGRKPRTCGIGHHTRARPASADARLSQTGTLPALYNSVSPPAPARTRHGATLKRRGAVQCTWCT